MTPQFLARQILIDAYTRLFETGEQTDWQAWGAAGGHDRVEARHAVEDLRGRNLARPVGGGRLMVTTVGVERVERQGLADAALIAGQFALRRKILRALEERRGGGEEGLPADQIAEALGEPVARLMPSLLVLRDRFLLQAEIQTEHQAEAAAPPTFRISETGRRALQAARQSWPLSADLEGLGGKSHGGQSARQHAAAPAGEVEGAGEPEGDVEGESPVGAPEGKV
jgi:hypothetical protein